MQGFCIVVLALAIIKEVVIAMSPPRVSAERSSSEQKAESVSQPSTPHKIYSVPSFERSFPDSNAVQLRSAMALGIKSIKDRAEADNRKEELVYVASDPYFVVEKARQSIPYLVPRAAVLLGDIGKAFLDSLGVKGIPLHKVIVTSILRTLDDVEQLQTANTNAAPISCHAYATTFDIAYNRYVTVAPPGEQRRQVSNDTLKWVLSEVLRDMRSRQRCYVKYEKKQGCFHITVR